MHPLVLTSVNITMYRLHNSVRTVDCMCRSRQFCQRGTNFVQRFLYILVDEGREYPIITISRPSQGSRSPDFGAEIRPHSQCQKVCFFPNSRQEIPNFTKKKKKKKKKKKNFFFFFFASPPFISYNINTEHIVTY